MLSHEETNLKIEDKMDIAEITVFYKTSTMQTEPTAPSCNNYTRKPDIPELGNILTHASDYYCHLFIHTEERERIKCRKQFLQLNKLMIKHGEYVTREENMVVRSLIATFVEKTCFFKPNTGTNCQEKDNEKVLEAEGDLTFRKQGVECDGLVHCSDVPVCLSMMVENDWQNLIQDFSELREKCLSSKNMKLSYNDLEISTNNDRQLEKVLVGNRPSTRPRSKSVLFFKEHDKYIQELYVQKSLSILRELAEIMAKKEELRGDQTVKECQLLINRYQSLVSSTVQENNENKSALLAVLKPSSSPSNSEDGDLIEENNCLEITSLSDVEAILEKFDLLAFQKRTNKLLKALESAALSKPKLLQIYPGCSRKHNDDKGQAGYKNTSIGEDSSQESFEDCFEYSSSDCSSEKVNNETRKKRRKKNPIKERCSRPRDHVSEVISTRNGNLVNETPESDDVSETSPKSRSIMGSKISSSLGGDIKVEVKSARKKTSGVMPKRSEQSMGGEFVRETNDFEKKSNSKSATTNIIDVGDDQSSLFKQERGIKRKPSSLRRKKRRFFSEEEKRTLVVGVKEYGEGKWKQILDSFPDTFAGRTSTNLKDLHRTMKRNGVKF
mmetsp:Transcript_15854/g.19288  ORF Transcript_15854/g.19288 Transcript_15854/m.19288 type:complete len:611 (+) Transcript_15854:120-1952(+)